MNAHSTSEGRMQRHIKVAAIALTALILLAQLNIGLIVAYAVTASATALMAATLTLAYTDYAYDVGAFTTLAGIVTNNWGLIYLGLPLCLYHLELDRCGHVE